MKQFVVALYQLARKSLLYKYLSFFIAYLSRFIRKNKMFLPDKEMQNTEEKTRDNLWTTCC